MPTVEDSEKPLYQGLADAIELDILQGVLSPGQKLPTHRELADALGMNVSTVTRGYKEAEKRGLVTGTVGRGTYVTSDARVPASLASMEPTQPGVMEMGVITPIHDTEPDLAKELRALLRRSSLDSFLRYGNPRGMPEHREVGAMWAAEMGLDVSPDNVVVCAGSQHGLACCLGGLFRSGERIATDCLTYPGMKTQAAMHGLKLVPITMDSQGMTPESLDAACRREAIRGLYLMPTVQNPTTRCMDNERRQAIVDVARHHDLIIVEDDAYVNSIAARYVPVFSLAPERCVYVAGVSKVLAAGLRVGFLCCSPQFMRLLGEAVAATIWMAPPLNVELACRWIRSGEATHIAGIKRERARARQALARKIFSEQCVRAPDTGPFIWLELAEPWKGYSFEARAREEGINVFGAERFTVGDMVPPAAVRISLTAEQDITALEHGLGKLAILASERSHLPPMIL